MRLRAWPLAPLLAAALAACGGTPGGSTAPAPGPTLGSLGTDTAYAGAASAAIQASGAGTQCFDQDGSDEITVLWEGHALATSAGLCAADAIVPAADLATPGAYQVTVEDGAGRTSSGLPFYVLPAAQADAAVRLLVSANLSGQPDDGANNSAPAISATGRYVAFQSLAD
ncbi:MAG: hypothetical protein ACRD2F_05835, partial [Terriglobales bacterium]